LRILRDIPNDPAVRSLKIDTIKGYFDQFCDECLKLAFQEYAGVHYGEGDDGVELPTHLKILVSNRPKRCIDQINQRERGVILASLEEDDLAFVIADRMARYGYVENRTIIATGCLRGNDGGVGRVDGFERKMLLLHKSDLRGFLFIFPKSATRCNVFRRIAAQNASQSKTSMKSNFFGRQGLVSLAQ
jgi:hypothetical protein